MEEIFTHEIQVLAGGNYSLLLQARKLKLEDRRIFNFTFFGWIRAKSLANNAAISKVLDQLNITEVEPNVVDYENLCAPLLSITTMKSLRLATPQSCDGVSCAMV